MPSAKELRDELRMLRKESQKPVSKMKVGDCAKEIERLKGMREESPSVAATPADRAPKKMMPKIADVKVAKEKEFPTAPQKKSGRVVVGGSGAVGETTTKAPGKKNKLEKLMAMLGDMTDSDEE
jgi:hypothetical protein